MRKITATQVFNGESFFEKPTVLICADDGEILAIEPMVNYNDADVESYHGILCPGFINAHCHLELSFMKGKIAEGHGLIQFIMDLLKIRNEKMDVVLQAIADADEEMKINGIVGVGDISNDDHSLIQKTKSKIRYHTFVEAYGFNPADASTHFNNAKKVFDLARSFQLQASITPHATYSVPPQLFEFIFSFTENHPDVFSIHNQETYAETDFFNDGSGPFKYLLEQFFKTDSTVFKPTGKRSLESVLPMMPSNKKILLVHNTESNANDIASAKNYNQNLFWCTCPHANLYIEKKLPDYNLFQNEMMVIGTDSLASNHRLSVLDEMKAIQKHFPKISTEQLLKWGTSNGASFFNWDDLGNIAVGKKPAINLIENADANLLQNATVKRIL